MKWSERLPWSWSWLEATGKPKEGLNPVGTLHETNAQHGIYNAMQIPEKCSLDCGGRPYGFAPLELSTATATFAARSGRAGFFYTSSMTQAAPADVLGSGLQGLTNSIMLPLASPVIGLYRGVQGKDVDVSSLDTPIYDFIVGGSYDLDAVNVYAGYAGSRGLFSNFSQDDIGLILTSMLTDNMKNLSYLRLGLDRSTLGMGEQALKGIGLTTLDVRQQLMQTPRDLGSGSISQDAYRETAKYSAWSLNVAQQSVAQIADVEGMLPMTPKSMLSMFRLGIHNPGFHVPHAKGMKGGLAGGFQYGVTAGMVRQPDMPWYGVQAATRFSLKVELRYAPFFFMSFRRNDPEMLTMFPFAADSWSMTWSVGIASVEMGGK